MSTEVLTPTSFAGLKLQKPKLQTPYINMLVYGVSSVGKTTLAGSAYAVKEMRNVLYVDVEAGTLSLRKTPYSDVDVVEITRWEEIDELYAALLAGAHPYQTIVFDSLTDLQELDMEAVMKGMKEDPDNSERDPDIPGWTEWNKSSKHIKKLIRLFRGLKMNVVFTALMKEEKNPRTGKLTKVPDLPGKLAWRVPALFDVVLLNYMGSDEEGNQHRLILSVATDTAIAKNRGKGGLQSPDMPNGVWIVPHYEKTAPMSIIYNTLVGEANK